MNMEQALQQFKLGAGLTSEQIEEALEQQLFELKNEVLTKYMVPTLLVKKLTSLLQLAEAETLLLNKVQTETYEHGLAGPYHSQTLFMEAYEKEVSALKLLTTQTASFNNMLCVIDAWIDMQEHYMTMFKEQFNEFSEALPEEANSREIINTGALLMGLKAGELDTNMIWSIERELARISKLQNIH